MRCSLFRLKYLPVIKRRRKEEKRKEEIMNVRNCFIPYCSVVVVVVVVVVVSVVVSVVDVVVSSCY